jgi:hypothetical protein
MPTNLLSFDSMALLAATLVFLNSNLSVSVVSS